MGTHCTHTRGCSNRRRPSTAHSTRRTSAHTRTHATPDTRGYTNECASADSRACACTLRRNCSRHFRASSNPLTRLGGFRRVLTRVASCVGCVRQGCRPRSSGPHVRATSSRHGPPPPLPLPLEAAAAVVEEPVVGEEELVGSGLSWRRARPRQARPVARGRGCWWTARLSGSDGCSSGYSTHCGRAPCFCVACGRECRGGFCV